MSIREETLRRLAEIPDLLVIPDAPLAERTRFGIGGPADIYAETARPDAFTRALDIARASGLDYSVIGGGSNLIVSDSGFPGVVLKLIADRIEIHAATVTAEGGAVLQDLVDRTIASGLRGLDTMTGIPGSVGAAVYGNAGAYGHSISEIVQYVRFYDGRQIRSFSNEECHFHYRESIFKQHKEWIILAVTLILVPAGAAELKTKADAILAIRNEKYPPTMKCAGSIFKNFLMAELPRPVQEALPAAVIREGKVPSAYFLEQVGAKGLVVGGIEVASYHANLIYNTGGGTARQLRQLIADLKQRVWDRFGITLEEEVQYVGPQDTTPALSAVPGALERPGAERCDPRR